MSTPPEYTLGDILEVHWFDAVGLVNEPLSKAVPSRTLSRGKLVKTNSRYIVLESGIYFDDTKDPMGDYTAIPRGWIGRVRIIERGTDPK